METLQGRAEDRGGFQKTNYSVTPPFGINIHVIYFFFGSCDGAMLWEAEDHRTAREFILRVARPAIYKMRL